jgi:general secretion pathway protein F
MIAVGEEAGKLDRILLRVAVMFEQQAQRSIERFMTALTPILTLTVAFAIGALIIPIISVIVGINDMAGR